MVLNKRNPIYLIKFSKTEKFENTWQRCIMYPQDTTLYINSSAYNTSSLNLDWSLSYSWGGNSDHSGESKHIGPTYSVADPKGFRSLTSCTDSLLYVSTLLTHILLDKKNKQNHVTHLSMA